MAVRLYPCETKCPEISHNDEYHVGKSKAEGGCGESVFSKSAVFGTSTMYIAVLWGLGAKNAKDANPRMDDQLHENQLSPPFLLTS